MPVAPEYLHLIYPQLVPFETYLYGRNSRDPKKKGASVDAQLRDGRVMCAQYDWPIKREFRDTGISASRHARRKRDDFEEMIDGIGKGDCRIVVAFEASRYYRDLEVYVRLRNACAAAGVLLCYNGQVYDLSKREDRKLTAQDALAAEDEAEGIRDRVLRTVRQQAEDGKPHGRIPHGYARKYDPDTGDLIEQCAHPEYGPHVVEVFERIAAGESGYRIVRDFAERGILHGRLPWKEYHLVDLLRNPAYIGRRVFQGKDIGEAQWPALVPEDTWYAVQQILKDPRRLTTRDRSVKHLQSFLAWCGECDGAPHLKVLKNRNYLAYQCSERFDTVMRKELLDDYVEAAVVRWLSSPAAAAAFEVEPGAGESTRLRLAGMEEQLREARAAAKEFRADGRPVLSVASLAALESDLEPQIEALREESASRVVSPLLRGLVGNPDAGAVWEGLVIEQQREVLRTVVNIRLHRARVRGVRRIEPGRISLTFVGEEGFGER